MDGCPETLCADPVSLARLPISVAAARQRTLKRPIGCVGVGLHCGRRVQLTLHPAAAGHGIVFRRTDLPSGPVEVPARFDRVVDTRLCTGLASAAQPEIEVGTVEHLTAALFGCGIDNALIELDGPEVPILDGSAAPFVFLLDCAGVLEQDAPRREIEILRPVRVEAEDAYAELRPSSGPGFAMALSIAFDAPAIGRQALSLRLSPDAFRAELARARTFTLISEVAQLQAAGRAKGGSLDNAIVVDAARVLNPGGLRMPDEFVRHKLLDAVGDLALAGAALRGRFVAHRSGHTLNNRLLCALFADRSAWRLMEPAAPEWFMPAGADHGGIGRGRVPARRVHAAHEELAAAALG
ncbi:MAG: UDP-3-O-acyl-N-acetylglucosamine deacetylase [Alphaproteobacteria bacterium]|nr:UDP-3-O-acyl-N-acetylglucosamine deacetylase [Alphaproteobacteria bacterium]